ncbi:UNVERIFIED_CONTAM: hypothetical protein RMT77_006056 [Armadillidium vulgare]
MATVNSHETIENKLSNLKIDVSNDEVSQNNSTENQIDGKVKGEINGVQVELPPGYAFTQSLADDEVYNMNYKKRGYCVIFNHKNFDYHLSLGERNGTDRDRDNLSNLFVDLGFKVDVYNDSPLKKVKSVINSYAYQVDHSECDCFVMIFMSHGEQQILWAKDDNFKPDILFNEFTADNCPSLSGKPKLFFVQACRGDSLDKGYKMVSKVALDQTDSGASIYTIPNHADFLVCWSTVPGHYSWRNTTNGSWFIQSLVLVFRKYANSRDVLTMMTMVNRHMILNFESNCPSSPGMHMKKQSASLVSTLMRLIYLKPKA